MNQLRIAGWLLLCATVAAALAFQGYRNHEGYCAQLGRPLTDEEMVQAAVGDLAYRIGIAREPAAVRAWMDAHPGCCDVDRTSHLTASAWERSMGFYWIYVAVFHDVRPDLAHGGLRQYNSYVQVGACGDAGSTYGEFVEPGQ